MPTYEYLCQKCNKSFELLHSVAEYEEAKKGGLKCPKCGNSKVIRQISSFQVKTSRKS
jgi:putative FmdB family regulatory protein